MNSIRNICSGDHDLEEICVADCDHLSEDVVRWCSRCGAIVIDVDYDGRVNPGGVMQMRFPTYG